MTLHTGLCRACKVGSMGEAERYAPPHFLSLVLWMAVSVQLQDAYWHSCSDNFCAGKDKETAMKEYIA